MWDQEGAMVVPRNTITVTKTDRGFVATTSLLDEAEGRGQTKAEAVANLDLAARVSLRAARDLGREIPEAFRVSAARKVVVVVLVLLFAAVARLIGYYLSR